MDNKINHFVSKEKLERLALQYFSHLSDATADYEVEAEDEPYGSINPDRDLHISRLYIDGRFVLKSVYEEKYFPRADGFFGYRRIIKKETELLSDDSKAIKFYDHLKRHVPLRMVLKS